VRVRQGTGARQGSFRLIGFLGAAPQYAHLLRSQYWSPDRLRRYTEEHLARALEAAGRIPFYRERFGATPVGPADLPRLPIVSRREIPLLVDSVRSLDPSVRRYVDSSRTSGSTGMPVSFLYDAPHQATRFAARARYLRAHGWTPLSRNCWIISTSIQSPDAVFSRRARWFGARFLSHLVSLEEQAHWLRELDPAFLYAYPVNLDGLSRMFEAERWRLPSLRRIFSGSEVLEPSLRERLRRVFGVEVADNYGSTEAFLAWQCPAGSYHMNAEHVLLEIVDDAGQPVGAGEMGRVLVTTLHNRVMPLIRYAIGDYAFAAGESCECGRTLPLIGAIAGRELNLFVDGQGKRIVPWALFRPLTARGWVKQYQIVQRPGRLVVRFVADREMGPDDEAEIRQHFATVLRSAAAVELDRVAHIPRAPSGKFMLAMNEGVLASGIDR